MVARCPQQAAACPVGRQRRAAAAASVQLRLLLYIEMGDKNLIIVN